MKYKSELIHEILGQRGHEKSTLHYQSECVKSWVDETKGAYPKLCDYEGEWLNYIVEDPIGEFPYETVSTNSMTTVNNVVPFEYKSAILRGQTENICDRFEQGSYSFSSSLGTVTPSGASNDRIRIKQPITGVSGLLIITLNDKYEMLSAVQDKDGKVVSSNWSTVTTKNLVETDKFYFSIRKKDGSGITPNDLYTGIISVTGYDLFEMKQVQMPVLTTTGKNLLNISPDKIERVSIDSSTGAITESDTRCATKYIKATPKDDLFLKRFNTDYKVAVRYYHNNQIVNTKLNNWGGFISDGNLKVASNDYYNQIRLIFAKTDNSKITPQEASSQQIMLSRSQSVVFEPYKSNILTVTEDVTLRGIDNVHDTLDLMTGEVTERIGEIVLDGSENWVVRSDKTNIISFSVDNLPINTFKDYTKPENKMISNRFRAIYGDNQDINEFIMGRSSGKGIIIGVFKNKVSNLIQFKEYLSQNNVVVQYCREKEAIKTVDLTVVNQDGEPLSKIKPIEGTMHIEVSGSPIAPTAVLEVPVEAITQNLNSFIEEE